MQLLLRVLLASFVFLLALPTSFASAATPPPRTFDTTAFTQLEISRIPLSPWAGVLYPKDKGFKVPGGMLIQSVRMTSKSLPPQSLGAKELPQYAEVLVLVSEKNLKCYIPTEVAQSMGFETVEDFRVYLEQTDVSKVECVVNISTKLNVAEAVVLYFAYNPGPDSSSQTKPISKPKPRKPVTKSSSE